MPEGQSFPFPDLRKWKLVSKGLIEYIVSIWQVMCPLTTPDAIPKMSSNARIGMDGERGGQGGGGVVLGTQDGMRKGGKRRISWLLRNAREGQPLLDRSSKSLGVTKPNAYSHLPDMKKGNKTFIQTGKGIRNNTNDRSLGNITVSRSKAKEDGKKPNQDETSDARVKTFGTHNNHDSVGQKKGTTRP